MEDNPESSLTELMRSRSSRALINYVNGRRSVTQINRYVLAETGYEINIVDTVAFFELLKEIGYITY